MPTKRSLLSPIETAPPPPFLAASRSLPFPDRDLSPRSSTPFALRYRDLDVPPGGGPGRDPRPSPSPSIETSPLVPIEIYGRDIDASGREGAEASPRRRPLPIRSDPQHAPKERIGVRACAAGGACARLGRTAGRSRRLETKETGREEGRWRRVEAKHDHEGPRGRGPGRGAIDRIPWRRSMAMRRTQNAEDGSDRRIGTRLGRSETCRRAMGPTKQRASKEGKKKTLTCACLRTDATMKMAAEAAPAHAAAPAHVVRGRFGSDRTAWPVERARVWERS